MFINTIVVRTSSFFLLYLKSAKNKFFCQAHKVLCGQATAKPTFTSRVNNN